MRKLETTPNHIDKIIAAYCIGDITSAELQELKEWVSKSTDNRNVFDRYYSTYKKYKTLGFLESVDVEKAWKNIIRETSRSKSRFLYKVLPYAAAILLPLVIGIFLFLSTNRSGYLPLSKAPVIEPGTRQATLFLADGSKILPSQDVQLEEKDGTKINLTKDVISYNDEKKGNAEAVLNTLYIPRRGEMLLELSDGTKVWINSESTLVYPTKFTGDKREVTLQSGEAYFEVEKDATKPFYLKVKDARIKVLGTSFNIKAYNDENEIVTTLVEGEVAVSNDQNEIITLKPGYQAVITKGEKDILVAEVDTRLFTSWKDGIFVFEDMSLAEIMTIFSRWYDVEVFYDDARLQQLHFTGKLLRYKNINPHLEIISRSTNVDFKLSEEAVLVFKD